MISVQQRLFANRATCGDPRDRFGCGAPGCGALSATRYFVGPSSSSSGTEQSATNEQAAADNGGIAVGAGATASFSTPTTTNTTNQQTIAGAGGLAVGAGGKLSTKTTTTYQQAIAEAGGIAVGAGGKFSSVSNTTTDIIGSGNTASSGGVNATAGAGSTINVTSSDLQVVNAALLAGEQEQSAALAASSETSTHALDSIAGLGSIVTNAIKDAYAGAANLVAGTASVGGNSGASPIYITTPSGTAGVAGVSLSQNQIWLIVGAVAVVGLLVWQSNK